MCIMLHGKLAPAQVPAAGMNADLAKNGYKTEFSDTRLHHAIYLSNAQKVAPENWEAIIHHPIKRHKRTKTDALHKAPQWYCGALSRSAQN